MKKIIVLLILFVSLSISLISVSSYNESSYILLDYESGRVLYEKNKEQRFLTASIAKIMTTMVAIENGNLFDTYTVDYESSVMDGSSLYLKLDEEISLYDLLCGLMLRSGNDAASVISKNVFKKYETFIKNMNMLARRIGMGNSTFLNPSGLNDETSNYSTAFDMALLMKYALDNPIFYDISTKKKHIATTNLNTYNWVNKHKLVQSKSYVLCGKTGYTKDSGRTLVSYAEISGMKLIAVSFNENNHYELHDKLFNDAVKDFTNKLVLEKGVYEQKLKELRYYPSVINDVYLPIKNNAKITVNFKLSNTFTNYCGYFEIIENNVVIYTEKLYPYYLKS